MFGDDIFSGVPADAPLEQIQGDIRDQDLLRRATEGVDAVIHLACISNDPSVELDPELSRRINYEAFPPLVEISRAAGVERFIFASSSSVYGISDEPNVAEDHPLVPLTAYNRFKAMCEPILLKQQAADFTTVVIRPATLCGYSPRQRLDLTVNILTTHAVERGKITVFGGSQYRPNLHIDDMVDLYVMLLELPAEKIAGKVYNAGFQNHTVAEIAQMVKRVVEEEMPEKAPIEIETTPSDDLRSYRICSDKIREDLGFVPKRTLEDAVRDLIAAFRAGKIPDPLTDERYHNVKVLKRQGIS